MYSLLQAQLRVLSDGQVRAMTVKLAQPVRLIPVHTKGRPPSYFIIAGLVFGQVCLHAKIDHLLCSNALPRCTVILGIGIFALLLSSSYLIEQSG